MEVGWLMDDLARPLLAYMDPGSGSLLLQLLLGGAAGAVVALKLFWSRLTTFFRPKNADKAP